MKVVYRHYEPDQGLDELQAKIYTEASGLPARAEEIRQRNLSRDPKMTWYALTEKGDPLAYITSRDSGSEYGRTYIGYPWTMPNAPTEVQAKLFGEISAFLKTRKETRELATTVVFTSKIAEKQLDYWHKKGFVEEEWLYRYVNDYDVNEAANWKISDKSSKLTCRKATKKDLDILVELSQADPYISTAFPTVDAFKAYFKDRVLKDGHAVLIFDKDKLVAASAPLRIEPDQLFILGDEARIIMRFTSIRPGYQHVWKRLVSEVAKEIKVAGWPDTPLRISFDFSSRVPWATSLAAIKPEIQLFEVILKHS
ncbi:MAG: hypothetical protein ACFE8O_04030 [Candidatus Hermodarchaeota archaeon]